MVLYANNAFLNTTSGTNDVLKKKEMQVKIKVYITEVVRLGNKGSEWKALMPG